MIIVNKYIQIVSFFVLSAMFYEKNQKKIIECAITGHYCHCWKVLNHDITTFPATECDRSRQRAERSLLSNLDPRVWHLVTPKDMFSSSHWLSWWNICSVVNGVIVASHSCGLITVKFIDLCSSMTWFIFTVQQCECVSARVCKSGRHCWFYLFFPSYTSFFFHCAEQFISVMAEVSRVFVIHFLWGCVSQTLNNNPHPPPFTRH